ncbi:hypothetical protein P4B35_13880 [Pontiellaceae bacterium B12227]|nr:hypothetical protein [Pontiellaceae bacterium B12227]
MKKSVLLLMFILCFGVWAIVVDNLIVPSPHMLEVEKGRFAEFTVKERKFDGRVDLLKDKLLIAAEVEGKNRYFMLDRTGMFETALRLIPEGTEIELRYSRSFPKFWQRTLYEIRVIGFPVISYTDDYLKQEQAFIYKFTGAIGGLFLLLCYLGLMKKNRRKK